METKKTTKINILASIIVVVSVMIIGISGSFSYFTNSIKETNGANKGVTIQSGGLNMSFGSGTTALNAPTSTLIDDSNMANVTNSNNYTAFSIDYNSNSAAPKAQYNLYLTAINITDNYKSADVKWALYTVSGSTVASSPTATGNFASIGTNTEITLKSNIAINKGTTTNYRLYIYLDKTTADQSNLLNGSLSGKLRFDAKSVQ